MADVSPEYALIHAGGTFEAAEHEDEGGIVMPPEFADDALALAFTRKYGDHLRYVAAWGCWYEWTGRVWARDETVRVFDLARNICRSVAASCAKENVAKQIASAKTVSAVEKFARADRRHAAKVDQWDTDPWLLNTPAGAVDLKTGILRSHRPENHITKITAVAPRGECPQWRRFLAQITKDDEGLQGFLQRAAGYSLTGSTREHALFFGYGTGGNGKGVFLNTLTGILGDYAAVASIDTFTSSTSERHPTDLAMLRGARLVTAQETEEGRRWAESRIKAMTGGDPITARFMRQDFFTYQPAFKLFIAGNHKPGLRSVDEAIRRRFNLIPFDVKIPASERDPELPDKLKAEWPGILKWAIEGCLEWQRIGLSQPQAVAAATLEYFEAEDAFGQWLAECCVVTGQNETGSTKLFKSWSAWAHNSGEFIGSQKAFSQKLTAKGYVAKKDGTGRSVFVGIDAVQPSPQHRSTEDTEDTPI
jgi:putative DNA primase/helicase